MNDQVSELAQRSMALSADERSRLVDILLESLYESPNDGVELAWAIENERRLSAYDRGEDLAVANPGGRSSFNRWNS
jgi:hypothetical protein